MNSNETIDERDAFIGDEYEEDYNGDNIDDIFEEIDEITEVELEEANKALEASKDKKEQSEAKVENKSSSLMERIQKGAKKEQNLKSETPAVGGGEPVDKINDDEVFKQIVDIAYGDADKRLEGIEKRIEGLENVITSREIQDKINDIIVTKIDDISKNLQEATKLRVEETRQQLEAFKISLAKNVRSETIDVLKKNNVITKKGLEGANKKLKSQLSNMFKKEMPSLKISYIFTTITLLIAIIGVIR